MVVDLDVGARQGNPLVRMTRKVWGCVDPNVVPAMNDVRNPNRWDPQWVEKTRTEGECVSISCKSVWEPLSQDHNGLTYVTYKGTIGMPGSFWVPTAAMTLVPPAATAPPPAPAPPPPVPEAPLAQRPSARPEPGGRISASPDTTAPAMATPVQAPPETKEPDPSVANTGTTTQGGSAGGGLTALLLLFGVAWMVRRLLRRGKRRGRGVPMFVPNQPRSSVPETSGKQSASKTPALAGHTGIVVGGALVELHPSPRVASAPIKGSGKPSHVWHPPGVAVMVAGVTVPHGMVYVGRSIGNWGEQDASFIDPALAIARNSTTAGPLGSWPSYQGITPECRRRYLDWLSSGKKEPDIDIGYVFLYFYGLERRLIVDGPPAGEAEKIMAEVLRLRALYSRNGSFNGYSSRLLDVASLLYGSRDDAAPSFLAVIDSGASEMPLTLKVAIADEVVDGRPLGFELAAPALLCLREFRSANRHVLSPKALRPFLEVLRPRFEKAFPSGFTLRNRKDSRLFVSYKGAGAGLMADLTVRAGIADLPDPATLTWTKLLALGCAVAEEIAVYAKALAYHPARAESLAGLASCPAELRGSVASAARRWLDGLPSPAAVTFGELAGHAIGTSTAKWTVRHRRQVSEALSAVGFATEPDPDDGTEHLEDATTVHVFRCSGATKSRPMEVAFAAAILVAAFSSIAEGPAISVADHWLSRLPSRLSLTSDQTTRLRARLGWIVGKSVSLAKAKRALGDATPDEREFCAWSATVAAGATGRVGKPQVALLEAIHDTLLVPRGTLYAGLHAGIGAATSDAEEPVLVSDEVSEVLHPIPRPPTAEPVDFDSERLARIRAETERVSAILADIFVEDEPHAPAQEPAGKGAFPGLDAQHASLLSKLLSRPEWPRAEFDGAASKAGLMPGGAMETINEWAFDHLGDAILDDGDVVVVNRALLPTDPETVAAE